MKFTEEQERVIEETFNSSVVIVNAYAGTGKTTTCFGVIQEAVKRNHKVLYLVFNKAMQIETEERAKKMGLNGNVEIKTVHALAYRNIARTGFLNDKIVGNIRVKDIADVFNTFNYDRAYFILKVFLEFLYSDYSIENIEQFFYKLKQSSVFFEEVINRYAISAKDLHLIYECIEDKQLPCPHDFYLKKFIDYLKEKKIYCKYDLVILDESQDANPCFASLLKHIDAKHLLMVGDRHQWIYLFRGSVNLMEKFESVKKLYLTNTFRFDDDIAELANKILQVKGEKHLLKCNKSKTVVKEKAIISRTNSGLLQEFLRMPKSIQKCIVFERGIEEIIKLPLTIAFILEKENPYYYQNKDVKVLDIIDESFYRLFKNIRELKNYIKEISILSHNGQASGTETDILSAYRIADSYGVDELINFIRNYNKYKKREELEQNDRIYMATAHSAKGQEYKKVILLDDFSRILSKDEFDAIKKIQQEETQGNLFTSQKPELPEELRGAIQHKLISNIPELNLLYVAITRASDTLIYTDEVAENVQVFDFCKKYDITIKPKKEKTKAERSKEYGKEKSNHLF